MQYNDKRIADSLAKVDEITQLSTGDGACQSCYHVHVDLYPENKAKGNTSNKIGALDLTKFGNLSKEPPVKNSPGSGRRPIN